jgi:hypothetical protein
MVAKNDEPSIRDVTPALIRAATGFRFTETMKRTVTSNGQVVEEITEVHDRYAPPDPQAAMVLFQIGREVLGKDFPL